MAAKNRVFGGDMARFSTGLAAQALRALQGCSVADLEDMVGGLSSPSKMPGLSYNLPAITTCRIGAMLAFREGSVCFRCYALKGRYVFEETLNAQERRLSRQADPETWAAAMAALLGKKEGKRAGWFRWHDAGEVRGPNHRNALVWIAEQCPSVQFWLPSREYATWKGMGDGLPNNLCVRLSAHMVGKEAPAMGFPTSTVGLNGRATTRNCPAYKQGGKCLDCRSCWDRAVPNINYPLH